MRRKVLTFLPLAVLCTALLLATLGCPSSGGGGPTPTKSPAAPSSLAAVATSSSTIQTSWTDNSDNEDNFNLEYSKTSDFTVKSEVSLPADTTGKLLEGLEAGTKYHFRVYAGNAGGHSEYSNTAEATTGTPPEAGTMVINNDATYTTTTSVAINNNITGAAQMRFQNAPSGAWSDWAAYAAIKTWSLASGADGTRTVNGEFKDASGNVLPKSDSIILDSTAPLVSMFNINNTAGYATQLGVTLYQSVSDTGSGGIQVCFSNDNSSWSGWVAYASTTAWNLASGADGPRTVYAKFKDAAGNVSFAFDTITLDTSHPSGNFSINGGAAYAWTTAATLTMNVTGATQMRFSNDGSIWSAWETYASTKSWPLAASENHNSYVYARFKDAAGNETSYSAGIYYDAVRTLRITAEYITISDDGDNDWLGGNNGEIYWNFTGIDTEGNSFVIYNLPSSQYHSMREGTYNFTDMAVTHPMANVPGESFQIRFQIFDDDSPLPDDASSLATVTYSASGGWGVGTTRYIYAGGSPSGYMYFKIDAVD